MTATPVRLAIAGALGRMGQAVDRSAQGREDVVVTARFDRPGAEGEALVSQAQALSQADAIIDFTIPEASVALVIGSTGLSPDQIRRIDEAAKRIPIVRSGNYSLGVNMLLGLVAQAARALPADFDIEVFEAHHRRKVDAPSGTALMLGEAAARGRGVDLADVRLPPHDGITGARKAGGIGFSVVRGGGIIGDHSVIFAGEEEVLTLSHHASDRGLFARGAIAAATWAVRQPPGVYDMQDVLGLKG